MPARTLMQAFSALIMLAGLLSAGVSLAAQTPAPTSSDANAPKTEQDQRAALKNEERANKARAKADHAQRKALRAQDKADRAAAKAATKPQ